MASFVLLHILLIKRHIRIMNTQWYQKATHTREIFKKKTKNNILKSFSFLLTNFYEALRNIY